MVQRRIAGPVRPTTTAITGEAMLCWPSDFSPLRAPLAGASRIRQDRDDAEFARPGGDEVLQRPKRPAVGSWPQPQFRFDAIADMGQTLDRDGAYPAAQGFADALLAGDMVNVTHVPWLSETLC